MPLFWPDHALTAFDALPLSERAFVRARAFSAPLEALVHRVQGRDVADVGCGHGVLVALLAATTDGGAPRRVTGVDPDPRKFAWAQASVGRLPHVTLVNGGIDALADQAFDTVCVADVVYLLPQAEWPAFFAAAFRALTPGGTLLLKEAENDGSWRAAKALWQERLMVSVLHRTHSSGAVGIPTRQALATAVGQAGFELREVVPLGRGYSTPHVLLVARKPHDAGQNRTKSFG